MLHSRTTIWIPLLLGAFAVSMLALAWWIPRRASLAELQAEETRRSRTEEFVRVQAANAARDAILRRIHKVLETARELDWSGEYIVRKAGVGGDGQVLLLGATSYAWLSISDVRLSSSLDPEQVRGVDPEFWPDGAIAEYGTLACERDRIHLRPANERSGRFPHEFEWRRDEGGRHVRVVGEPRWIDARDER